MVDFSKSIYTSKFKFTNAEGVEEEILLKPLKGKHFAALYDVVGIIQKVSDGKDLTGSQIMEILNEENVLKLHSMCLETLKNTYTSVDEAELEGFVSSHFMKLFPAIIELHFH